MPEQQHDVVVIGASAGGVEALVALVSELPGDLPAAVLIVLHISAAGTSVLPDILSRSGPLKAVTPENGTPIDGGCVYVAPPDRHLLIVDGSVAVSRGPRENGHRPAIDPLFRSAAATFGPRAIGVVLSGARDDGTAGLRSIKAAGGATIVQDPDEALYASMPSSALAHVEIDWTLPVREIAPMVSELVRGNTPAGGSNGQPEEPEVPPDPQENEATGFTCPECGGALWQLHEGRLVRFKCRVGHTYSLDSMFMEQSQALEGALWAAKRSLEERRDLLGRLAARMRETSGGRDSSETAAKHFEQQADEASARAALIEKAIMG